jgi:hypothetical protein
MLDYYKIAFVFIGYADFVKEPVCRLVDYLG